MVGANHSVYIELTNKVNAYAKEMGYPEKSGENFMKTKYRISIEETVAQDFELERIFPNIPLVKMTKNTMIF